MSANGASQRGATKYQTTKWAAEEAVRNSDLDHWCVLRPGLIFGDPGMEREATVQALTLSEAHGQTIPLVGPNRLTYIELLDMITRALGMKPKPKIKLPLSFVRTGMRFGGSMLPVTPDQLTMLIAGNVGDASHFYNLFQVTERPFNEQNLGYLHLRL